MKFARAALAVLLMSFLPSLALADSGMISKKSAHSVAETIDRLEAILKEKGLTIFARIDHAAGAKKADLELAPTQVLIFGNPKLGTPLMAASATTALDLPQKALAYQDASGDVFLVYNNPAYLMARHEIAGRDEVLKKITGALDNFTNAAVK
ncbi:MAG: DUF302 domain-containing protein [Pseudomonadota bacterium]